MSPNILTLNNNFKNNKEIQKYKETKKLISKYQQFIKKNFNYVGENFAYEARSLYYKDKKSKKGIYGMATKKDIKELKEEGIKTAIIPWIKDITN